MTRLARLVLVLGLAAGALLPAAAGAAETEPAAARATAEALVEGAHGALADPGLDEAARNDRLRAAVSEAFAFDIWERFLLGERGDGFSDAQRTAFRAALPGFLAHLYKSQFGKGLEAKPEIRDTRAVRSDVIVSAGIPRANGKTLPVDWRIREFAARGALVIDVMVGGVSFLVLKREEFGAILDERGPEGLLAFMAENSI
ncbi:hypothetical protein LNKW23_05120 [Paralimibaculum aggregatum]|uniref:ABC transporter substrate-binding protein n=1 Tax=Paralimibaculum aggregatum TaxID=3036245 RepID=A0ABQ6LKW1_9RHOB|nr:ABC transporter substrate-binding protein [Limibaculum sp. NKW23]GMG81299.1 hypothetical protein LNKW23_05120 [Limibaculum sp. NKW23]